jgi:DNA polymerase-1
MHIRLIDSNSLGYAHHLGQAERLSPGGMPVQALTGLLAYLKTKLERHAEVLNVFVWDGNAQWRHDLHSGYKDDLSQQGERQQAKQDYAWQQPWLKKALRSLPVLQVTHPNAEATDVGWGLSRQLSKQGHLVTLESGNPQWLQSVDGRVRWQNAKSPYQVVELEGFHKASGGYPTPASVGHIQALVGDPAEGVGGVPAISLTRAMGLVSKYKTVDSLLTATDNFAEFSGEPTYTHALMTSQVQALLRRNLALMDLSQGPALKGEGCTLERGDWDELEFYELLVDLGLDQWKQQFSSWRRLGEQGVGRGPTNILQRAISELEHSW